MPVRRTGAGVSLPGVQIRPLPSTSTGIGLHSYLLRLVSSLANLAEEELPHNLVARLG